MSMSAPDTCMRHGPLKLAFSISHQHRHVFRLNQLEIGLETFTYTVKASVFATFFCNPATDPVLLNTFIVRAVQSRFFFTARVKNKKFENCFVATLAY